ncbi:MAG: Low-affinity inorganic phosphate transporter 1 [Spirochaetes bacterium ADurb.Bin218]|nr:MAG: Low-affinity inorganic phosphate transporter 1 [Spirochaetes bacterium ADurb.Bin218]HOQ11324.1 inorganic phosphate transporter [Spirochaetota bacterium]HOV07756.1 inorganic phosphate transporter [Spirochaetota bacterium]HPX90993.1 inorganic phosphate transporter [Spirochaetota bacterium]
MSVSILFLIALALFFDFLNGFHDAANSIATVVSTRVLSPNYAVAWAAFFNFIAFLFFGLHVADTIGKGIINPNIVDSNIIFATLMGACLWNLITWWFGLPTSSSHALMGGLAGSAVVKSGIGSLVPEGLIKAISFIIISPMLGLLIGLVMGVIVYNLFRKFTPRKVDSFFRKGQLISAAAYSLGHGGNDAQKTMGIIAVLLYSKGLLGQTFHVPFWVVISCQAAIALGTLFGGWRIVKTMGSKITKLRPVDGFCAETGAACTLFFASHLGIPVSTTHTITGAIVGVGSLKRLSAVRWGVAGRIVWAWIITIPAAAAIAMITYYVVSLTSIF